VWGKGLYRVLSECASAVCGACGLADRTTTCSGVHQLSACTLLFFLPLFVYKVPVDGNARRNVAQVQSTLMKHDDQKHIVNAEVGTHNGKILLALLAK